jgi:hypothetical protein
MRSVNRDEVRIKAEDFLATGSAATRRVSVKAVTKR